MHFGNILRHFGDVGKAAGNKLKKSRTQTVNITADISRHSGELFRTYILGGAQHLIGIVIFGGTSGSLCQPQIGEFGKAVGVEHDVVRFDILVNQLLFAPCGIQSFGDIPNDLRSLFEFKFALRFGFEDTFESIAPHILHGKVKNAVIFTHGIRLHNIGMAQFCRRPCLRVKAVDIFTVIDKFALQNFQCDLPFQRDLPGKKNLAHAAAAQQPDNTKISDFHARNDGIGFVCILLRTLRTLKSSTVSNSELKGFLAFFAKKLHSFSALFLKIFKRNTLSTHCGAALWCTHHALCAVVHE